MFGSEAWHSRSTNLDESRSRIVVLDYTEMICNAILSLRTFLKPRGVIQNCKVWRNRADARDALLDEVLHTR